MNSTDHHHAPAGAMRIGALARHFGINAKTIRYYEAIGLLPGARRTESGYRVYGTADVERLGFILRAKVLGLSLEEIRGVLSVPADGEFRLRARARLHRREDRCH